MPMDPEWHMKAYHCLEEFVMDVESAGPEKLKKKFPDLILTYEKACHILGWEVED